MVIFGGKGGVGKTSCAAGMAVTLTDTVAAGGGHTVIVSTDPAHSLGDVLEVPGVDKRLCGITCVCTLLRDKRAASEFLAFVYQPNVYFQVDLTSGVPVCVDTGIGSSSQLWALEVDPKQALDEFRELIEVELCDAFSHCGWLCVSSHNQKHLFARGV
jgi:anion-transporting  ArsA/GET3 family ATPase